MADSLYPEGLQLLGGSGDYLTDNIGLLLLNASGAFNETHEFITSVTANELSGTGYARVTNLSSKAITVDTANNRVLYDAADETYTGLDAGTIGAGIVYFNTGVDATSTLLAFLDPPDLVTNGSDVTFQFSTSPSAVFYLTY